MRDGDGSADTWVGNPQYRKRTARSDEALHRRDRKPRRGTGPRRPAPVPEADGGGKPAARRLPPAGARGDPHQPRVLLRDVSGARRAAPPARRLALRRPAADARHRPRAHVGAEAAAGRRAVGRPRADPGVAHHYHHQAAQGAHRPDGADGRAEFPPGDPHRRPRLHHRARRDRVRGRGRGPGRESAGEKLLPGNMKTTLTILLLLWSLGASSQDYPNRPVRMLVGYPAGGGMDAIARVVAAKLSELLGQPLWSRTAPAPRAGLLPRRSRRRPPTATW